MPDYPNNSSFQNLWNRTKEYFGYKPEPVTLARNISTNDRVALPDRERNVGKEDSSIEKKNDHGAALPKGSHLKVGEFATAGGMRPSEKAARYESSYKAPDMRITDEQAKSMSWNGAVHVGNGQKDMRNNSEVKVAKGYIEDNKAIARKMEKSQVMTL